MTTLNLQVGANTDDAQEIISNGAVTTGDLFVEIGCKDDPVHVGLRWTSVSGLSGATINTAVLTFRAGTSDVGGFEGDWYGEDGASPGTFVAEDDNISDRVKTTATCEGDSADFGDWVGGEDYEFTGDGANFIKDILQELADSYDPSAIVLIHSCVSGIGERLARSHDLEPALCPKLDIDYTAGGGAIVEGAAVITGTGALAAAAYAIASGASALSGTGALSASALAIAFGASALSGLGALEGVGVRIVPGASVLSGEGALEGVGVRMVLGVAALSGTGALAADAFLIVGAEAALSGAGALDADGLAIAFGGAALSGVGALTATGEVIPGGIVVGAAVLTGVGDLWGTAYLIVPAAALLSGLGALSATGIVPGERVPRGGMSPRFGAPSGWRAREDERLLEPAEETLGHI